MPTYPSISPLPPAPDPDSPATFNALAYPFTAALQTLVDEINAFSDAFEILISDAQYQALQLEGVNGQLLLPTLTGSGAAAPTTLSPAMRAALAQAGVASANRIPMLTGTGTAGLANVGAMGLTLLGADVASDARNTMGVSFENGAGFYKLPGGRMIQWGVVVANLSASNTMDVVFPIAFASPTLQIIASNGDWAATALRAVNPVLVSSTATGAQFAWFGSGLSGVSARVNYIAIGGWV